jgi:formylmethanofuran dehydrogenase subunit D
VTRANDSVTTSAHFSESQHVYLLPTQSWAGVVFEPSTRLSSTTIPIAKEVESPSCEATESKTDRVGRGIFQRADSHSPRGLGEREVVDR